MFVHHHANLIRAPQSVVMKLLHKVHKSTYIPQTVYKYLSHMYVGTIRTDEIKVLGQKIYNKKINYVFQKQNHKFTSICLNYSKPPRFSYLKKFQLMTGKMNCLIIWEISIFKGGKKQRREKQTEYFLKLVIKTSIDYVNWYFFKLMGHKVLEISVLYRDDKEADLQRKQNMS